MADIRAFRGYRYDLGRVGTLGDVVAPPYDVIDAPLQQSLYERSPYNVVRLVLNREEPNDSEKNNRYTRASQFLRDWQADGVLAQDSARALYVYHQEFEAEGERFVRRGFLARVRLEPFGRGKIFPHEETMSGPKEDRLRLFRACRMNLSPVFGLYPDEGGEVQGQLDETVGRTLPLEAVDHLGVVSRLWPITNQQVVSAVAGKMGALPVFIADGHHRYETGLRYLEERMAAGEVRDAEAVPHFILMMLVRMEDPGLVILPTHRLVSGIPAYDAQRLREVLSQDFQVETIGIGATAARTAWKRVEAGGNAATLGFGTASDGVWQVARSIGNDQRMAELAWNHSQDWRGLPVSLLHVLVLGRLLQTDSGSPPTCKYVHLLEEATEAVEKKSCQMAVLVPPASMRQVAQIAGNHEKMPPKSTYFYPKLLSGLVFNSLTSS